jgi:hypothetical protein
MYKAHASEVGRKKKKKMDEIIARKEWMGG